jgi:predicted nucleic acid-binding protein
MYGRVMVPLTVVRELRAPESGIPQVNIKDMPGIVVVTPRDTDRVGRHMTTHDAGEFAAIVPALETRAETPLIDERVGRREALAAGLHVIGTWGVLLTKKREHRIGPIRPMIESLQRHIQFFIGSDLTRDVLRMAGDGESP